MTTRKTILSLAALGAVGALLATACSGAAPTATPQPTATPRPTATPVPAARPAATPIPVAPGYVQTGHVKPDAYAIKLEPLGHWHIFKSKKLLFTVTDTASGKGKAGLKPVVQIARAGSQSVATRSLDKGQVKDEGNGVYSMEYSPGDMDSYAFLFRFNVDGQEFASAPVAAELVRDGEEGIKVEAKGTQYVYQIRYNWSPRHALHGSMLRERAGIGSRLTGAVGALRVEPR